MGGTRLMVFDLSTSLRHRSYLSASVRTGELRLQVTFDNNTAESIQLIVFSCYDSFVTIDSERKVNTKFAA
jgi:hypothetical protein